MDPADVLQPEERRRIVDVLFAGTTDRRVTWIATPRKDEFAVHLGSHDYVIYPKDHDGVAPFILDIYTDDGMKLAAITTIPRGDPDYDSHVNSGLEVIYNLVYRQVNRPEDAVKKLMGEIRNIETEREPPF